MNILIAIYIGLLGAIFGSFATALVWRLHQKKSFLNERSECEKCHHKLGFLDLIPIISFACLWGKCRYCHKKISSESTVMEILMAIIFAVSYLWFPNNSILQLTIWLIILVFFGVLGLYDFKYKLLPNKIILPLAVVSLVFFVIKNWFNFPGAGLEFTYALIPISGMYGLVYLLTGGKGIGMGDIKLGVVLAFIISWEQAIFVLFFSNILGIFFWILMQIFTKTKNPQISFGPALILATIGVFLFVNAHGFFNLFMV